MFVEIGEQQVPSNSSQREDSWMPGIFSSPVSGPSAYSY